MPAAKTDLVAKAVLAACDAADGVKDGLLNDPRKCNFDPGTLLCKGADSNDCLTALQVDSVKKAYAPLKTSKGALVYPGLRQGQRNRLGRAGGQRSRPDRAFARKLSRSSAPGPELGLEDLGCGQGRGRGG